MNILILPFRRVFGIDLSQGANSTRVVANTVWLVGDRVMRAFVALFVGFAVARYLEPARFGLLNFAVALCSMVSPVSALGLDQIVVRGFARGENPGLLLGTAFGLRIIGATCGLAIVTALAQLIRPNDGEFRHLVGILAIGTFFQSFDVIDLWFQSRLKSKRTVISRNVANLVVALVRVVLIWKHAPIVAFAYANILETAVGAIALYVSFRYDSEISVALDFSRKVAKGLLTSSLPLVFSNLAIMFYMRLDQVMVGKLRGEMEVGYYTAAVRLTEVWYFIPISIVTSIFPIIVATKERDAHLFIQRMSSLFRLMCGLAYIVAIPTTIFAVPIIKLLYGENFAAAAACLSIMTWAGLFVAIGVANNAWLVAEGLSRHVFYITFSGAICNVGLNFYLIPSHGAKGAAVATVISQAVALIASCIFTGNRKMVGKLILRSTLFLGVHR